VTTVDELKRVYAEGRTAEIGADNPYRGQMVLASVWLSGYRKMQEEMLANSPARQAYLREVAERGVRSGERYSSRPATQDE
jgi:hypothetical protein